MADIETHEESRALQAAHDELGMDLNSDQRWLFRRGWLAGRDWERQQSELVERERAEREAEHRERTEQHERLLHPERNCIQCDQKIERQVNVGRCFSAEPCGHRLGQGR